MKAVIYTEYGSPDVLQLKEVEKPTPKDNEVLIKVYATTVTTGDVNARGFVFVPRGFGLVSRLVFGIGKPKKTILGLSSPEKLKRQAKTLRYFRKATRFLESMALAWARMPSTNACLKQGAGNQTSEADIRASRCHCQRSLNRINLPEKPGQYSARTKNLDQWRFWKRGECGDTDCKILWRRSDGSMQRREYGIGKIPGSRSGH